MSYEPCDHCAVDRAEKNFERALGCHRCAGTGIVPTRDAAICNGCGRSLHPPVDSMNAQIPHGLANVQLVGGYDSGGLLDLNMSGTSDSERKMKAYAWIQKGNKRRADRPDLAIKTARNWP